MAVERLTLTLQRQADSQYWYWIRRVEVDPIDGSTKALIPIRPVAFIDINEALSAAWSDVLSEVERGAWNREQMKLPLDTQSEK